MSLGLIPQEVVNQIRERADIVEVVSNYVSLSKAGQNLKGLCPFHSEKTPSFNVSPSRQIFHCFGCGTGGNVITFLMKIEGASFPDTVRELGRRIGVAVPAVSGTGAPSDSGLRERLEHINGRAASWFRDNLMASDHGARARRYLADRGMEESTIESFGLGVALPLWDGLIQTLTRDGISLADMAAAGLAVAKDHARKGADAGGYYDRFRGRVMFPITDLRKRIVAFGGRIFGEGEPKYLNSPETALFNKGRLLYALDRAREAAGRQGRLIVVEGYFDAIALHQAGIANVVATLGTALTSDHLAMIRRFTNTVVLLFDPDAAGVRASLRCLDLFVDSGIGVTVMSLPDGLDPDAFVRRHGPESFMRLHDVAPSLVEFAVQHSLAAGSSSSVEDRIRSVDEVLRILQKTSHRLEKEEYMRVVAERLGISQQRLIERYAEVSPKRHGAAAPKPAKGASSTEVRASVMREEWDLVYLLIQGKLSAPQVAALRPEWFNDSACRRIVEIALRHVDRDGRALLRPILDEGMADAECHTTVTELSMAERHFDDPPAYVDGCLESLERKRRDRVLGELINRLRAAEREGRVEDARLLNAEVNALRVTKAGSVPVRST
jgi:DNA primase